MAKTIITIQSTDSRDIDLYFTLLGDKIAKGKKQWENEGTYTCIFTLDFKALQKSVTNKSNNVTNKQNLDINKDLAKRIKKYKDKEKMSYQKLADKLNREGFKNSRGNKLNKMQVMRLYKS